MIGCSSISVLLSGEDEVRCSSRGCASTGSAEGGVEGGEEESALLWTVSLLVFVVILALVVVLLLLSSVPFDTFIV